MRSVAVLLLVVLGASGCARPCERDRPDDDTALDDTGPDTDTDTDTGVLTDCPVFGTPETMGTLTFLGLSDLSGLAASQRHPGILWAHNDAGDTPRIFALTTEGELVAEIALAGAEAMDWEDIAVGPGPGSESYLYIGDIGDRHGARDHISVFRLPEPDLPPSGWSVETEWWGFEGIYPEGAMDAEALVVDPVDAGIHLITRDDAGVTELHRFPPAGRHGVRMDLENLGVLHIPEFTWSDYPQVTGADISVGGDLVTLRTETQALVWRREGGTLFEAIATPPCVVPLAVDAQGEAIAFAADGSGLFTSGEGEHAPIHHVAMTRAD